jgi:hypothetical protein
VKLSEKISFHPAGFVVGIGIPLGSADVREEHWRAWLVAGCSEVRGLAVSAEAVPTKSGREIAPTAIRLAMRDVRM